jgi:UDP-N-acetylmuramoylalanine--D-glutamate ligase
MIDLSTFKGKTIAVMGLGKSGLATARALVAAGVQVCAWDDSESARDTATAAKIPVVDLKMQDWTKTNYLVLSPGIPHTHPKPNAIAAAAKDANCPIVGDIELLVQADKTAKIIAITGTNGKSTTTALIGHILGSTHRDIAVGGNLGTPVLELPAPGPDGYYVLELSSYQLELTPSLSASVAVLLNISADHLDRHGGMRGYIDAKKLVFRNQQNSGAAIIGTDEPESAKVCRDMAANTNQNGYPQVTPISGRDAIKGGIYVVDRVLYDDREGANHPIMSLAAAETLPGDHNAQNAAAAAAACLMVGLNADEIARGIETFPGLAHRQQLATVIDGVRYINDSKATNADAAARALASYETIYWIAGGLAKEGGLDALMAHLHHVRHAFLIGEAEEAFAEMLQDKLPISRCGTLDQAIEQAHRLAQKERRTGAVVLLSPACASWDQFASFEVRGAEFCRLATRLPGGTREIYWNGETDRAA